MRLPLFYIEKRAQDKQKQKAARHEDDGLGQWQKPVRFIEEGVKTQYAGVFNIGFGPDAVLFIFGNSSLDPRTVQIESKMAVSLKTAKRMAVMLGNLIRRYEAANGTIDISAPQPANEERIKIQ